MCQIRFSQSCMTVPASSVSELVEDLRQQPPKTQEEKKKKREKEPRISTAERSSDCQCKLRFIPIGIGHLRVAGAGRGRRRRKERRKKSEEKEVGRQPVISSSSVASAAATAFASKFRDGRLNDAEERDGRGGKGDRCTAGNAEKTHDQDNQRRLNESPAARHKVEGRGVASSRSSSLILCFGSVESREGRKGREGQCDQGPDIKLSVIVEVVLDPLTSHPYFPRAHPRGGGKRRKESYFLVVCAAGCAPHLMGDLPAESSNTQRRKGGDKKRSRSWRQHGAAKDRQSGSSSRAHSARRRENRR